MENPIIMLLYWFENFCLIILGGVIFNYSSTLKLRNFALAALINAFFLYFIRNLFMFIKLPLNLHLIISLIFFILVLRFYLNLPWVLSLLTGILGYIAVIFNEMTIVYKYIKWFNIPVKQIATNIYLHLGLGLLADMTFVIIILLILLIKKFQVV